MRVIIRSYSNWDSSDIVVSKLGFYFVVMLNIVPSSQDLKHLSIKRIIYVISERLRTYGERKLRHGRILEEIQNVEDQEIVLWKGHRNLEKQVHLLDKKIKEISEERNHLSINEHVTALRDVQKRLFNLEAKDEKFSDTVLTFKQRIEDMDKLHLSSLHLLEAVEEIESKLDENVPSLQQEVSKLKFNMEQISSNIDAISKKQVSNLR